MLQDTDPIFIAEKFTGLYTYIELEKKNRSKKLLWKAKWKTKCIENDILLLSKTLTI